MPADLLVDPRSLPATGFIVLGLLGLAAATLAAIGLYRLLRPRADARVVLRRWLTWIVLASLWALACLAGPLATAVLLTALALVGLREFGALTALPASHRALLAAGAVLAGGLALAGTAALLAMIPLLLLVGSLQPVVAVDVRNGMRHLAFGALAFGYLPLLLAHGTLIAREAPSGGVVLFVIGVAVAFSDIGAYVVGRSFGRHLLTPALSPNKTIEGLAGNLIGASVGYAIFLPVLPALAPAVLAGLVVVVAVGAVWGDLFESALKREFEVKDTGAWLPGFGGILDRIDSLILVLPLSYYLLRAAGTLAL